MTTSPAVVVSGVFLVIGSMAFTIGAMYLGGGSEAIRRQVPQLALFAAALVAVVFAVPFLMGKVGDLGWVVVLIALNAVVVVAWVRQARQGQGPLVAERRRAAFRMPAFRRLALVWGVVLAVGTVLLILATRAGY